MFTLFIPPSLTLCSFVTKRFHNTENTCRYSRYRHMNIDY